MNANRFFPAFLLAAFAALMVELYPALMSFLHHFQIERISSMKEFHKTCTVLSILGYLIMALAVASTTSLQRKEMHTTRPVKLIVAAASMMLLSLSLSQINVRPGSSTFEFIVFVGLARLLVIASYFCLVVFVNDLLFSGKGAVKWGYAIMIFVVLSQLGVNIYAYIYHKSALSAFGSASDFKLFDYLLFLCKTLGALLIIVGWFALAKGAFDYDREFIPAKLSAASNRKQSSPASDYMRQDAQQKFDFSDRSDLHLANILRSESPNITIEMQDAASMELFHRQSPLMYNALQRLSRDELAAIVAHEEENFKGYVEGAKDLLAKSV